MARQMRWWFGWLVMMGAASAAYAGNDASLAQEDRILQLERTVETLADELQRTRADMAVPEDGTLESAWGLGPGASKIYSLSRGVSLGGYAEAAFRNCCTDVAGGGESEWDMTRVVAYLGYKFNDRIVFNTELEFEHGSTEEEEGSVSVEFATLDFMFSDELNARMGLLLLPMGLVNEIHEPPFYFGRMKRDNRDGVPPRRRDRAVPALDAAAFADIAAAEGAVVVVNRRQRADYLAGPWNGSIWAPWGGLGNRYRARRHSLRGLACWRLVVISTSVLLRAPLLVPIAVRGS